MSDIAENDGFMVITLELHTIFSNLIAPHNHIWGPLGAILVYGVFGASLILNFAIMSINWIRNAKKELLVKQAFAPSQVMKESEIAVRGTVEYGVSSSTPVRFEVEQEGVEKKDVDDLDWRHIWTEVERRVIVSPFYLRTQTGERVRVEPQKEKVRFLDDFNGVIWVDLTKRIRKVELISGKEIVVYGSMKRDWDLEIEGYRGANKGWVLLPPKGKDPMLFSSDPLEDIYTRRKKYFRFFTCVSTILIALYCAVLLPYHLAFLFGDTLQGTIVDKHENVGSSDKSSWETYEINVKISEDEKHNLKTRISKNLYDKLAVGSQVPIRKVSFFSHSNQLGKLPTLSASFVFMMCLVWFGLLGIYYWVHRYIPKMRYNSKVIDIVLGKLPKTQTERLRSLHHRAGPL